MVMNYLSAISLYKVAHGIFRSQNFAHRLQHASKSKNDHQRSLDLHDRFWRSWVGLVLRAHVKHFIEFYVVFMVCGPVSELTILVAPAAVHAA